VKILITGGAGFLGSHLVEVLKGHEVTVVDDFSTAKYFSPPPHVRVIRQRVEDFQTEEKFDVVAHLAARPSPEDYMAHPVDTALSNSLGTQRMLEVARRSDAVFFYTSTSEVYGKASLIPTPEDYWGYVNPIGPRSCYDESKRFSEALAMAYYRQYGLDVRIHRPFNIYGPRLREDGTYGRVISRFIYQALRGEYLTVFGDGLQTRAFLYVEDWVDAAIRTIFGKGLKGEVINVGSDREVKILDLAETVIRLTGSRSKVKFLPPRPDDPPRRAADVSKARRLLNWEPRIPLEEGLRITISWFKGVLQ
jgi:UDP-glucuronate decarboxylase